MTGIPDGRRAGDAQPDASGRRARGRLRWAKRRCGGRVWVGVGGSGDGGAYSYANAHALMELADLYIQGMLVHRHTPTHTDAHTHTH